MKKCLALLLPLTMILGMVACPAGTTEPSTHAATPAPAATQAPAATEAPVAAEAVNPLLPTNEGVTLTIGLTQYTNVEDYKDNALTKWLEEQTGYNLEFVLLSADHAEAVTQLTAMMAGGETLPDILWGIN
ncbi:MAG: hypothetical protein MJ118_01615, partial [Clostridia bacterium]|nr:hypothetical protein [Clostridia bacterium]